MQKIVLSLAALIFSTSLASAACDQLTESTWKCDPPQAPATSVRPTCHYYGTDLICNTDRVGQPVEKIEKLIEPVNCGFRTRRGKREHVCW